MLWLNNSQRFGVISQLIHWSTVLLVGLAWVLGLIGDDLPKGDVRELGETLHISAGLLIGWLLVIRIVWLMTSKTPKTIPFPVGNVVVHAGKIAHITLYLLLFGAVATGITLQFARGQSLSILGLYELTSPWIKDRPFAHRVKEFHEFIAHSLIILATVHAVAALVHHFVLGDNTLKRMLPFCDIERDN